MKSYIEILVYAAVVLVLSICFFAFIHMYPMGSRSIINDGSSDKPELQKATRLIMEQVEKEKK